MKSPETLFNGIFCEEGLPFEEIQSDKKRVSEFLSVKIPEWELASSIFITAPTGSGKSTFVFDDLADFARQRRQYILVLSNRLALNLQQKIFWPKNLICQMSP